MLLVRGDGVSRLGEAAPGRVLVGAALDDRPGREGGDLGRAVDIRKALTEVHRPGRLGAGGHLGEDGGAETAQALDEDLPGRTRVAAHPATLPGDPPSSPPGFLVTTYRWLVVGLRGAYAM